MEQYSSPSRSSHNTSDLPQRKSQDEKLPLITQLLHKFLEQEHVDDVGFAQGPTVNHYQLKIMWKSLSVQLNISVNKSGTATFKFTLPNQHGSDKLKLSKDQVSAIDKLINLLNMKKTATVSSHIINFKRDPVKQIVETSFTLSLYDLPFEGKPGVPADSTHIAFRKLCYTIFSNSLMRIKSSLHLFHYLIRFPNLRVDNVLLRNEVQQRAVSGPEASKRYQHQKVHEAAEKPEYTQEELTKCKQLAIVPFNNSKILNVSKTFLGRGGFGEVRYARFTNK